MENVSPKVALNPAPWTVEAATLLAGAAGNSPTYTMSDLEREVNTGSATLYGVFINEVKIGFVVLWWEDFGGTRELIIQSGAAFAADDKAVAITLPVIEEFAKSIGCTSMRAHSNDKAMIKRLLRYGFAKTEIVVQKVF